MSAVTTPAKPEQDKKVPSPALQFRADVMGIAKGMLTSWVGEERAAEAVGRVTMALAASAASARNPADFYACTRDSVGRVIAISALTGIMPSTGRTALAYAIPRRPRQNEAPQLNYQLSHRGVAALARRAGNHMLAVPIGVGDVVDLDESGLLRVVSRNFDNPPTSETELRGVQILVRDIATGNLLCNEFMPKKLINIRRAESDSYQYAIKNAYARDSDPWHKWYVEQAMKTAMHYAISRGWCVVDDTEAVRALGADMDSDIRTIDAISMEVVEEKSATQRLEEKLSGPTVKDQVEALQQTSCPKPETAVGDGRLTEEEKAAILKKEAEEARKATRS